MKRTTILVALAVVFGTFLPIATVSAWNEDKHPKCEENYYLNEDHKCVPKRCPYDESLTITDKKCVKPPVCPTNPDILQSDDKCVVTPPPAPEPTPNPTPTPQPTPVPPVAPPTSPVSPPTDTSTSAQLTVNGEMFTGK